MPMDSPTPVPAAITRAALPAKAAAVGVLAVIVLFTVHLMNLPWPYVGIDQCYFMPRLFDVHLHYLCNGISIQWWTPSFGGGLPAFANPNHTQFMLAQALLGFTDLWTAVVLNFVIPLSFGFLLVYKFAEERLAWSPSAALIAAALFATSNYNYHQAFSGHMGDASFPLVSVLPFCLDRRTPAASTVALGALAASYMIMTGGYTIIVVYGLTALVLATGLGWYDYRRFPFGTGMRRLALAAVLTVVICAAKLCAVSLFLQQFPRLADYHQPAPTFTAALASLPAQFFAWQPAQWLHRFGMVDAARLYARLVGPDDCDMGISPLALIFLPFGMAAAWHRARLAGRRQCWLMAGAAAVAIWLAVEFSLGRGLLWPWIKPLPFLRSLQANYRFASAFVLPIILVAALGAEVVLRKIQKQSHQRLLASVLVLGIVAGLVPFRRLMFGLSFDATGIMETWSRTERTGERWSPIVQIADVKDADSFRNGASSWHPYDSIFGYGYGGPVFRTQLSPGPVQPPGHKQPYNLNHPVAFVSPAIVGLHPFDRLPAIEAPAATLFLSRRQPDWPLPISQHVANYVSLAGLTALVGLLMLGSWRPAFDSSDGSRSPI